MRPYKVTLEIEEWVEADSAQGGAVKGQRTILNGRTINDGTYHVEPDC